MNFIFIHAKMPDLINGLLCLAEDWSNSDGGILSKWSIHHGCLH